MRCLCPRCCSVVTSRLLVESICLLNVMCLVWLVCILISCSAVVCVLMALGMFMKDMTSLIRVMSSPHLVCALCLCVWWCSGVFWCFSFLCEFWFLYCDDVWLGAVYEFF